MENKQIKSEIEKIIKEYRLKDYDLQLQLWDTCDGMSIDLEINSNKHSESFVITETNEQTSTKEMDKIYNYLVKYFDITMNKEIQTL